MSLPVLETRRQPRISGAFLLLAACMVAATASARAQRPPSDAGIAIAAAVEEAGVRAGPPATLTYANRPIVELRASLLGRPPGERVVAARLGLDRLVNTGITAPVEARMIGNLVTVSVGGHYAFAILPADIDPLAGETLDGIGTLTAQRLQVALKEMDELRRPRQLLVGTLQAIAATAAFVGIVWMLMRMHRAASVRLCTAAARRLEASAVRDVEFVRSSHILDALQRMVRLVAWAIGLVFAYAWLAFTLQRFPLTRPWGESLREHLLRPLSQVGAALLASLPETAHAWPDRHADAVCHADCAARLQGRGRRTHQPPWVYAETAQPTRKLVTAALWLFALAIAYPHVPGSNSDAFKGVSLFVGVIVSLGSSGLVNQMMSGLTLTYSRAFRPGDLVAVGDVRGIVTFLGTLSTKIRTAQGEEITIPNAVAVSKIVINYSRFPDSVLLSTDITIGYDVPWRQVEALLLMAAARSPGVRREPAPFVRYAALEDSYVKYTLLFCPERPTERLKTLTAVHAHILDAFNEYGVQITSPRYETDPDSPKIVPRDRWYPPPTIADTQIVTPKAS
jgi:small-conductance mechanosensitive channel